VTYGQVLLFITRALINHGYWTLQADDRALLPELNGPLNDPTDRQTLNHRALVTYVHYVQAIPDVSIAPNTPFLVTGVPQGGWGDPAPRGWFTRAFWPALDKYFGQKTTLP
jgi:hypothetical protein